MATILTEEERRRYSRTTALGEIGEAGQARIRSGSVLVVGCGALGSVAALYLAGGGVGRIGLMDFDTVDESNLQRQIAYSERERGMFKAERLSERLKALNSNVNTEVMRVRIDETNAREITGRYDVVVEGSDSAATKHLVAREACGQGKACVVGGVSGWKGQAVTLTADSGDLYGEMFGAADDTYGSGTGVFGPVPGIVGSIQAAEALKILAGTGKPTARMVTIDVLNCIFRTFEL